LLQVATLKDAEAARAKEAERLRRLGAHAIEVRQVQRKHRKTFVVVALFERNPPKTLPRSLSIIRSGKPRTVELIGQQAPPFQADR
jgi:hypothetical protein